MAWCLSEDVGNQHSLLMDLSRIHSLETLRALSNDCVRWVFCRQPTEDGNLPHLVVNHLGFQTNLLRLFFNRAIICPFLNTITYYGLALLIKQQSFSNPFNSSVLHNSSDLYSESTYASFPMLRM